MPGKSNISVTPAKTEKFDNTFEVTNRKVHIGQGHQIIDDLWFILEVITANDKKKRIKNINRQNWSQENKTKQKTQK